MSRQKQKILHNLSKHPYLKEVFEGEIIRHFSSGKKYLHISLLRKLALDKNLSHFEKQLLEAKNIPNYQSLISKLKKDFKTPENFRGTWAEFVAARYLIQKALPSIRKRASDVKLTERNRRLVDVTFKVDGIDHLASVKSIDAVDPLFSELANAFEMQSLRSRKFRKSFYISYSQQVDIKLVRIQKQRMEAQKATKKLIRHLEKDLDQIPERIKRVYDFENYTMEVSWRKTSQPWATLMIGGTGFREINQKECFKHFGTLYLAILERTHAEFIRFYKEFGTQTEHKHCIIVTDLGIDGILYNQEFYEGISDIRKILKLNTFFHLDVIN